MPPENFSSLPFLTRKMLSFEHAARIQLRIITQSAVAANVTVRGITREGSFTFNLITDGSAGRETFNFNIPDIPIMLSVVDSTNSFEQGQLFGVVLLLLNGDPISTLTSGLIYSQKSISWPNNVAPDLSPQTGYFRVFTGTDRAAGNEISEEVPANLSWKILGIRFQLVTAATAGSRRVHVVCSVASAPVFEAFCEIDQIISETKNYTCGTYGALPDSTDDNDILIPISSRIILPETATITTETTNFAAGDNFGAPKIYVEQFFRQ